MPQIYSGRQQDQLFNGIGNKLVRRSNALEDDYTGDVNPELRRVINEMHAAGLLSGLRYIVGPDGYEVTGPNRINRVREIVPGSGDATQGTASDQPELSRTDDRMNLVTHSRIPGTLGDWDVVGWGAIMGDGEIVASDDPSDDHQAFELSSEDGLYQQVDFQNGQKFILAARIEAATSTTAEALSLMFISHTVLDSYRDIGAATNGEWLWLDVTLGASGVGSVAIAGDNGDRFSRPCLLYRPDNWAELSAAEKQTYLTDHYAASGPDHAEFPGFNGMRTVHFDGQAHSLSTEYAPLSEPFDGWTMFWFGRIHSDSPSGDSLMRVSSLARWSIRRQAGDRVDLNFRGAGDVAYNNPVSDFLTGRLNDPVLITMTGRTNASVRGYRDHVQVMQRASPAAWWESSEPIGFCNAFSDVAADMISAGWIDKELQAAEVATLNSILKGES